MRDADSTVLPDLTGYSIAFDLDGTLVETAPDLVGAVNHVLASRGRGRIDEASLRALVGHGARALIERAFAETGDPADAAAMPGLTTLFLDYYRAHIADFSRPYPGTLARAGAALSVCTNKAQSLAEDLLDALGMSSHFAAIVGSDALPVHKPDPEHFFEAIRRGNGDRARALLVGDSPTDAATARNANVPFIAVTFGYTPVPPEELGADVLIGHFDELDSAVAQLAAR